nr:hypothetical protein [Tanacetum cinerariifolium]
LKRKGLTLEQESVKKLKTSKEVTEEAKSPNEVLEEKVKVMMRLVPIEEVYVEVLQVEHPIIDWKVHTEGQRAYWKITRLGGSSAIKDKEIFMLVENDYPLRKGLAIGMISYKLQVENYSRMANDLILKIYKIASTTRQQEEVPTASEESCHCQKKREAITVKIALLLKSRRNCQSKTVTLNKDEQVLLAEDQAWMESSSDSDREINANMVFMAQIEKVLLDSEASSSSGDEKISE